MPLKSGYDYMTVRDNIADMVRSGHSAESATAASYAHARKDWFVNFPEGVLPEWMAYPPNRRLRSNYNTAGHPLNVRVNPDRPVKKHKARAVEHSKEITAAARLYENFTGHKATEGRHVPVRPLPKTGLAFGELVMVGYRSNRDGELYQHTFRATSRPLLVASHDGKQVVIVGGRYAFTDRGIVDK
jgi:hypothetical protein